ncbi:MAG: Phosphate ABC transporter substrate-binding protein, PhoT family [Thermotoga petrophila]|uniref:Phosphate-binding protein n=1 Tax=Thermotoga petrophila TaxID=93929 RepID=A0A101ERM6_9THEM|nr:MAG: Phosphate ABC transporter substrate-binding protein, PhoT family [Thermotoga petrophila]MDK2870929.1 phosphate transport system substrate-binding protein [bacterium]
MRFSKMILVPLLILSIASAVLAQAKDISMVGSTTVLPIAQACAEEFMDLNPNVNVSVKGGGSGVGIAALIDGTCDIANASRPMKVGEIRKAKEKGVNPVAHVIAKDGIAVVVHPSNPINGLTLEQLKAIYTGKINNWKEVGGRDMKIVVVSRDSASGTYETFHELVLKGEKLRGDALLLASNQAVATTVVQTEGAIGYIGLGYLSQKVKALKIDGIAPSKETVVDGSYKLARPLFMYTNGEPKGLVKEFIDFVLSPEGQKIVEEQGFIPVR